MQHELMHVDFFAIDDAAPRVICSCGWSGRLYPGLVCHAATVFDAHRLVALVDEYTATGETP